MKKLRKPAIDLKDPRVIVVGSVIVIFALLILGAYSANEDDKVDTSQFRQTATELITKNCIEEEKRNRSKLDCSRLEVGEPQQGGGGFMDPVTFSVGGSVMDGDELIWYGGVLINSDGKVDSFEATYRDPTTKEYISESKFIDN